jgi:hypothetical protein
MTLAKAKARANETFIVQASLRIVTYDCQNSFIVQAPSFMNHKFCANFTPSIVSCRNLLMCKFYVRSYETAYLTNVGCHYL